MIPTFRARKPPDGPPPEPERLTYAVGDIHGCIGALHTLTDAIAEDAGDTPHTIVFLGDYVDRGPDSAGVLRHLMALQQGAPDRVICLPGNHDRMMTHFIDDPEDGVTWLMWGGRETVISFGLTIPRADPETGHAALAAQLADAIGPELRAWLDTRPLWWRSGDLIGVHALTDPTLPMSAQAEEVLLWARPDGTLQPRADGAWVVHGHTIFDTPRIQARHVGVDTGAYRGRGLTAGVFSPGAAPRFLQVPGGA